MHRLPRGVPLRGGGLRCRLRRYFSNDKKGGHASGHLPPPPPIHVPPAHTTVPADIVAASQNQFQQFQQLYLRMQDKPWNMWGLGLLGVGVLGVIAFGPEMRSKMTKTTAEVATETLQNESLQIQTQELASQIVQTVLNDPKVLDQASQFLQKLMAMDATRGAMVQLTSNVLNDPQTLAHVTKLSKQILFNLFQDPATLRQFVDLIKAAIVDPHTRQNVILLLDQLMKDEPTRARLTALLAWTFVQPPVQHSVSATMTSSVHNVMSNKDVQDHAKEFIGGVVRDETVQTQSGEALWKTLMYVLTPTWVSWFWRTPAQVETAPVSDGTSLTTISPASATTAEPLSPSVGAE
ncbi:hypothetical protein H310_00254 [Aphanomyces invadans]|uniref:Uncharacterized protein n=1 Tax=Aphanomyces invadans TaxID=157072 RepID=A0A024UV14_9STRA|nr:hypothetical protein H310_00254 [Aphanomyces invadans]ETW09772.1 hypothetical protein H310_00254 [Aphanomyces invadans]|eukprot:XP_008861183.1 hypothetical protein H310_00254 [Aphanomyces invadans]